jgi:hypothetical protein
MVYSTGQELVFIHQMEEKKKSIFLKGQWILMTVI